MHSRHHHNNNNNTSTGRWFGLSSSSSSSTNQSRSSSCGSGSSASTKNIHNNSNNNLHQNQQPQKPIVTSFDKVIRSLKSAKGFYFFGILLFMFLTLAFVFYAVVIHLQHRWHLDRMLQHSRTNHNNQHHQVYSRNSLLLKPKIFSEMFHSKSEDAFQDDDAVVPQKPTTKPPESQNLIKARKLLENRRKRATWLRNFVLNEHAEDKRKKEKADQLKQVVDKAMAFLKNKRKSEMVHADSSNKTNKHDTSRNVKSQEKQHDDHPHKQDQEQHPHKNSNHNNDKTIDNNNNNNNNKKKEDESLFTNEQLDALIDYNNILEPVVSDNIKEHNETKFLNGVDEFYKEQDELLVNSLFEHPQTHEQFNLSYSSPLLLDDDDETLKHLSDDEIKELKRFDEAMMKDEQEQRYRDFVRNKVEETIDFPLAPTLLENAAELRRLRIVREKIERGEIQLHHTLQQPSPVYAGRKFHGRRRPLEPIPNMTCAKRPKVDVIPPFTRHDKNKRPEIAVISLVAKSKKHNADNTTRRAVMHEYTFMNKLQYCKKWGYDLIVEDETAVDRSRPPHWSKIRVLRKWLPFYKWVVWLDQDVMFTNWNVTIENIVVDELTRETLNDLKEQEAAAQRLRDTAVSRRLGHVEDHNKIRVLRLKKQREIDMARNPEDKAHKQREYDDMFHQYDLNYSSDAAAVSQMASSFKMKQYDLVMTHDRPNGLNSGVMFFRNRKWTQNLLRRMWGVPPELTKPFFDQGTVKWLTDPSGFRGRNKQEGAIDHNHLLDMPDNFFNSYPQNFIHRERDIPDEWLRGDFAVHGASCKFYPWCLDWIRYYYEFAQCNNTDAFDPPHLMFDVRQRLMHKKIQVEAIERERNRKKQIEIKKAQMKRLFAKKGDDKNQRRRSSSVYGNDQEQQQHDDDNNNKNQHPPPIHSGDDDHNDESDSSSSSKNKSSTSSSTKEASLLLENTTYQLFLHKDVDELVDLFYESFAPSAYLPPDNDTVGATLPPLDEPLWDVSQKSYPKNFRHEYFPKGFNKDDSKKQVSAATVGASTKNNHQAKQNEPLPPKRKSQLQQQEEKNNNNNHNDVHDGTIKSYQKDLIKMIAMPDINEDLNNQHHHHHENQPYNNKEENEVDEERRIHQRSEQELVKQLEDAVHIQSNNNHHNNNNDRHGQLLQHSAYHQQQDKNKNHQANPRHHHQHHHLQHENNNNDEEVAAKVELPHHRNAWNRKQQKEHHQKHNDHDDNNEDA